MKPQAQGLQLSLLIHAGIILGVLGLSLLAGTGRRPVVIDFNLEKSISAPPPPVQKPQEVRLQKAAGPPAPKVLQPATSPIPRGEPRPQPTAETPKVLDASPT